MADFQCNTNGSGDDTLDLYVDDVKVQSHVINGMFSYHLKSGISQIAAGAATDEVWVDTTNGKIKIGV